MTTLSYTNTNVLNVLHLYIADYSVLRTTRLRAFTSQTIWSHDSHPLCHFEINFQRILQQFVVNGNTLQNLVLSLSDIIKLWSIRGCFRPTELLFCKRSSWYGKHKTTDRAVKMERILPRQRKQRLVTFKLLLGFVAEKTVELAPSCKGDKGFSNSHNLWRSKNQR